MSKEIGKEKVVWRYDPVFFNERYTLDYHCKYFEILASKLGEYTEKCTVSRASIGAGFLVQKTIASTTPGDKSILLI